MCSSDLGEIIIKADLTLFEISNQTDTSEENITDNTDGYGLGLQLSMQLVKKIGWDIEVIKEGRQFLVRLDVRQEKA